MKTKLFILTFCYLFYPPKLFSQFLYELNDGNILAIHQKGQLAASISYWGNPSFTKGNAGAQLGYSPIQRLSLTGNIFRSKNQRNNSQEGLDKRKSLIANVALGYYYVYQGDDFEVEVPKDLTFLIDFYFGVSWGKTDINYTAFGEGGIDFTKYYFQFGFHLLHSKWKWSTAWGLGINDTKKIFLAGTIPSPDNFFLNGYAKDDPFSMVELSTRVHYVFWKKHSLFFHLNFSPNSSNFSHYENPVINYNLGLMINFP